MSEIFYTACAVFAVKISGFNVIEFVLECFTILLIRKTAVQIHPEAFVLVLNRKALHGGWHTDIFSSDA